MSHPFSRDFLTARDGQSFRHRDEEFVLHGKIGDGAAGVVRRATRVRDDKRFAVKFMAPDPAYIDEAAFDDVAARFKREGERGVELYHQSLVKIHAYCQNENSSAFGGLGPHNPFLLMDFIQGRTLESLLRGAPDSERGKFSATADRLFIALQLAEAIKYLHSHKLVHRDIKPANVFIGGYSPQHKFPIIKLGDFGIVKWGDFASALSSGSLTATSQRGLGTMKYMSPEQALLPKEVTIKSDLYSLGVTLFELFTNQILLSPHHVFELTAARQQRGSTTSRFLTIGYTVPGEDEGIASSILDMHMRGPGSRPKIDAVLGLLSRRYSEMMGDDWTDELNRYGL